MFGIRYRTRSRLDGLVEAYRSPSAVRQPTSARTAAVWAGAAAGLMIAVGLVLGPVAVALVIVAAFAGRSAWRHRIRATTRHRRRQQLPEALERLAGSLRTGSSLPHALHEAGRSTEAPLGPELTAMAQEAEGGRPLIEVLDRWTEVNDDTGTRLAATALALAAGVGAAPARAIDGVATTLRERLAQSAERRAQATQARYSAVVLSAAPLVFTGLLAATNRAAADFLLKTPSGWACLAIGLGLDAAGAVWMMRLTHAGQEP
jgi:tight adherence protein B